MTTLIPVGMGIMKGERTPDCLFCFSTEDLLKSVPDEISDMLMRSDAPLIRVPLNLLGNLQSAKYYDFLDGYETKGAIFRDEAKRTSRSISLNCDISDAEITLQHGLFTAVYEIKTNSGASGSTVKNLVIKRHGAFRLRLSNIEDKVPVLFDDGYAYYTSPDYDLDDATMKKVGVRRLDKNRILETLGTVTTLDNLSSRSVYLCKMPCYVGYEIIDDKTPIVFKAEAGLVRYSGRSNHGLTVFDAPDLRSLNLVAIEDKLSGIVTAPVMHDLYLSLTHTQLKELDINYTHRAIVSVSNASNLSKIDLTHKGDYQCEIAVTLSDIKGCEVINLGGKPVEKCLLELDDTGAIKTVKLPPCEELIVRIRNNVSIKDLIINTVTKSFLVVHLGTGTVDNLHYVGDIDTIASDKLIYQPGVVAPPELKTGAMPAMMLAIADSIKNA